MSNILDKSVLKILKVLFSVCDAQIDSDVSFWISQNKVTFSVEHRYGGGIYMKTETRNDEGKIILSSIWTQIGIWDNQTWTPKVSTLTEIIEKTVVSAKL